MALDVRPSKADDPFEEQRLVRMVEGFRNEARDGRRHRIDLNRRNFDALHNRMDWSHKIEGQTQEFLPKTGIALEQFAALVEKSITGSKDWYLPVLGRAGKFPLQAEQCRALLDGILDSTAISATQTGPIQPVIVDGIKLGALGSIAIFKVTPMLQYPTEGQGQFRIRVETVRQEDYYPDPTTRGLYEIHRSESDYYTVDWKAKEGIYDPEAVEGLRSWSEQERQAQFAKEKGHNQSSPPSLRRVVTIDEYWGDILDEDGVCVMKNAFMTIANERFVIRKPQPNPSWHAKSPFVVVPLIRVPNSVWHRALFDGPVELNLTLNELWSLMIDGAIGAVWGTRQLRIDDLENPEEVSGGVPQGKTLAVKSSLPPGAKVMEDVTNGSVPPESLAMFQAIMSAFAESAMTNELRLGNFTGRSVKATEVVEASQAIGALIEGIAKNVERGVGEILYLAWMLIIQHLEMLEPELVVDALGPGPAVMLLRTPPEVRKALFSSPVSFRVSGMSSLIGRTKDFQKMMALMQGIGANPILLMSFFKTYAPEAVLAHLIKALNIDPDQIKRDEESLRQIPLELQQLQMFNQVVGAKGGMDPGQSAGNTGESSLPAEINQMTNPLTGIPASR